MTNTKRALLSSVMALFICFAMLLGTTFAWFTDSVTSANNVIKSGNLDIALDYWDGDSWETVEGTNSLFTNNLWEPGHTEVVYFKLSNLGSLALKYQLSISVLSETEGTNMAGDRFKLSDYIQMGVVEGVNGQDAPYATREAAVDAVKANSGIIGAGYAKQGNMLADAAELYMAVVVYMPETVGNEANAKTGTPAPTINLGVQVLATQLIAESDSFDNQYDADATFGTYIELEAGADLLAAMASAKADMPLTIKLNGNVEWPTEGHHGENDITPASSIVIDGNGYTITATGSGVTPLGDQTAPMTLKNVKIVDNSVSYNEGAWELTYLEMGGTSLTCNNVTFADEIQTGTNATFTNCSFKSNEESVYAVWVEDGSATFTGCTFTGYRGLKMHEDYGTEISSVIVKNCMFSDIAKKPGIAIGTLNADTTVVVTNNTFAGTQAGDQGLYSYETDTDVKTFKFVYADNIIAGYADTDAELKEAVSNATAGDTIVVAAGTYKFPSSNIKAGTTIICEDGTVFKGNTGLNINGATVVGATFSNPTGNSVSGTINGTFKNCVFDGSNALRECYAGETVVFENCVFSGDVYGIHFDGGANDVIFKNCTFSGFNAMGAAITKLTLDGCKFIANGRSGYNGINLWGDTDLINCTFVFDGTAGTEWVDLANNNKTVTFTNCVVTDGTTETPIDKVVGNDGTGNIIVVDGAHLATSAEMLQTAINNGAKEIYAYGVEVEGTVQLNTGATIIGATFKNENGIAVRDTISGTFKDCTFEGSEALRWCYTNAGETVVFENCVIKTDFRGVHFDGMNGNVIFRNCEINGFNAIGGEGTVTFENCTFGNDNSSYNGLNMYSNINLIDCTFNYVSGKTNFIDMEGTGKTLKITNCKAYLDGSEVSITDFVGGSKLADNTVIVD